MAHYWLIKALLIAVFAVLTWLMVRPVHTARNLALRRLGLLVLLGASMVGVLFPRWLNTLARLLGVERGINLLVYLLVIAVVAILGGSYRRSVTEEQRMTQLARTIALSSVQFPHTSAGLDAEDHRDTPRGSAPSTQTTLAGEIVANTGETERRPRSL